MTNDPKWENRMWITNSPYKQYLSKNGGPCYRCHKIVKAGEKAAKVTLDAPVTPL